MKVLLLGDGRDDVGAPGKSGDPLSEKRWGALHILVARLLQDHGVSTFEFITPLPKGVALRDGVSRRALPQDRFLRRHIDFFLTAVLSPAREQGVMIVIQDQDCDDRRLSRLEEDARQAMSGIARDVLLGLICAVSVECTENWLLCHGWPPAHRDCHDLVHPSKLGCAGNRNRAKVIFDQVHGGGPGPRRDAAQRIARRSQTTELRRLREAEDFCLLESRLQQIKWPPLGGRGKNS